MEETLILTTGIAGLQYALDLKNTEEKLFLESLTPGNHIRMEREANNRFDHWAVVLFDQKSDKKLGYLSRYKNESIARLLDAGIKLSAVIAETTEDAPLQWKRSPTENLRIPISIYMVSSPQVIENLPQSTNVNLKLKADLLTLLSRAAELELEETNRLSILTKKALAEFAIGLAFSDGAFIWQEAELLEIYLGVRISESEIKIGKQDRKQEKKLVEELKQLYHKSGSDRKKIFDFSREYIRLSEIFGNEIIACDRYITTKEQEDYHSRILAVRRKIEERIPNSEGQSFEEQQILELKEHLRLMNFTAGENSVQELVKKRVDKELMGRKLSTEQEEVYRRFFKCDYAEQVNSGILKTEAESSQKYRELKMLIDEVSEKMLRLF